MPTNHSHQRRSSFSLKLPLGRGFEAHGVELIHGFLRAASRRGVQNGLPQRIDRKVNRAALCQVERVSDVLGDGDLAFAGELGTQDRR